MLLELKCPNNRTAKGVGCSNISKTRLSLDVHAATVNVTSLAKLAILSLSIVSVDSGTLEYSGINTLYIASFGSSIVECAFQIFVNRNVTGSPAHPCSREPWETSSQNAQMTRSGATFVHRCAHLSPLVLLDTQSRRSGTYTRSMAG